MLVLRSNSQEEFLVDFSTMRVEVGGKKYILMMIEKMGIGVHFRALVHDTYYNKDKYVESDTTIKSIKEKWQTKGAFIKLPCISKYERKWYRWK